MKTGLRGYFGKLIGRRNLLRLTGATAGSLLGFFILMMALQLWFDVQHFMQTDEDDLFAPGIVVVNKRVSMLNTLGLSDNTFSEDEIQSLRKLPFIHRAEPFVPCRFKVEVSIDLSGVEIPNLVSEFFFESVPDDLVDIPASEWQWDSLSRFVPVVLPSDFLKFYNFGFAPGQNLPQLSEKGLRLANLKVGISGNGKQQRLNGRIVGLSEKINTILVPESFLKWANERYGHERIQRPARLVIVSRVAADPNLTTLIRDRNYETGASELRSGKLNQILQLSLVVTGVIGLVIILLALYLFLLSFSLFIVRSDYEIRTLVQLGVNPRKLIRYLFNMLLLVMGVIFSVNSLMLWFVHQKAYSQLLEKGIGILPGTSPATYLLALGVILVLLGLNYLNIRRNIHRVAR